MEQENNSQQTSSPVTSEPIIGNNIPVTAPVAAALPEQKKSHIGMIVTAVIVLALVAAGMYFKNDFSTEEPPMAIDSVQNSTLTQTPADTTPSKNQQAAATIDPMIFSTPGKNCGSIAAKYYNPDIDNSKDPALTCLGQAIINDCQTAELSLKDGMGDLQHFRVAKNTNNTCAFQISYDTSVKTTYKTGQKLAGLSIMCPASIAKRMNPEAKSETDLFIPTSTSNPGQYAADIYAYGILGVFYDGKMDASTITNLGCRGDYINANIAALTTNNTDGKHEAIKSTLNSFFAEASTDKNMTEVAGYGNACENVWPSFVAQLKSYGSATVTCFDSKDSLAASASVSSGGFICFDSNTGLTENLKTNITGPKCK